MAQSELDKHQKAFDDAVKRMGAAKSANNHNEFMKANQDAMEAQKRLADEKKKNPDKPKSFVSSFLGG